MIYISKTSWDMFKGSEEAEAGNTNRQAVVYLENFSFLWVSLLLISALHLFMEFIPVLATSCACSVLNMPKPSLRPGPWEGCTWTSDNQYFIELFTEGRLGDLPALQRWVPGRHIREAMEMGFISAEVWQPERAHQVCTATVSRDVSQSSGWFVPPGCVAHPATVHSIYQVTKPAPWLLPALSTWWHKFIPVTVFLLQSYPILHKLAVSISFFMNTRKRVINSTSVGLDFLSDECVKWCCNPGPGWGLENSFQNSFLLSLQSNTCNILPTTLIKD